jgi:cysteine-rich repeat protein
MSRARRLISCLILAPVVACYTPEDQIIQDPDAPVVEGFISSFSEVTRGETVRLEWTVRNANTISITAEPGEEFVNTDDEDGVIDSPAIAEPTTFTLTAIGKDDMKAVRQVTVGVRIPVVTVESFTAAPERVVFDTAARLSWVTTGAKKVELFQGPTLLYTADAASLDSGMFDTEPLAETTTFLLVATTEDIVERKEVTVEAKAAPVISSFYATPGLFIGGATDILVEWSALNVEGLELRANGVAVPDFLPTNLAAGMHMMRISDTTALELVATGVGPEITAAAQVAKANPMPINAPGGTVQITAPAREPVYLAFTITIPGQSISALLTEATLGCTARSSLMLFDSTGKAYAGSHSANIPDGMGMGSGGGEGGGGGGGGGELPPPVCAELRYPGIAGNVDLAPGMYYLELYNEHNAAKQLEVTVTFHNPGCGNGALEGKAGETCDDGNLNPGDGCDALCVAEVLATDLGPGGPFQHTGTLDPATKRDRYLISLSAPAYLDAQTFTPAVGQCNADTVLELYKGETMIAQNDDPAAGISCAHIQTLGAADRLEAGNYVLLVRAFGNTAIPQYALNVQLLPMACGNGIAEAGETCDDGNLAAGDGCNTTCQFEGSIIVEREPNNRIDFTANRTQSTPGNQLFAGAVDFSGDLDNFVIEITGATGRVFARTHTATGDELACEGIDTMLELVDASGKTVAMNDDDGGNQTLCSYLSPVNDLALASLTTGKYYLRVGGYDEERTIPRYFVTVRVENQ